MSLPIVAIVGRPNVGKSSLFNSLIGRRISIVDATPGVTRDRVSCPLELQDDRFIELVDTGGMGVEDTDNLTDHVEMQISYAISAADLVLFVVDAREGVIALDEHVAKRLRREDKPVLLLANKMDQAGLVSEVHEMHRLGFGAPVEISAAHNTGIAQLPEQIVEHLGSRLEAEPVDKPLMRLAIVGKRNAGKSTFINALAGQERVIVSEVPGTTRDSVDVEVQLDGRKFMLIDTAGVRKRKSLAGDIEFYSFKRAMGSIGRADVVGLFIDASVKISQVDKKLSGEIAEQFKPVVLVVNKWDLAENVAEAEDYAEYLAKMFPHLSYAPISLTTATEGANVRQTIDLAWQLFGQAQHRMGTGELNQVIREIVSERGPSHKGGTRPPKILYATQVATAPPTIVLFVNHLKSFDETYRRYLFNQLQDRTEFAEVPIRLIFRQRRGSKDGPGQQGS